MNYENDFVCAGYFLIRKGVDTLSWFNTNPLAPPQLLSLSPHICNKFSAIWSWIEVSPNEACEFDPVLCDFEHYKTWCHTSPHAPLGTVFSSVTAARTCTNELGLDTKGLWLIGAGFPRIVLDYYSYLETLEAPKPQNRTYQPNSINDFIEREQSLEAGGKVIGFDLVYQWLDVDFDCCWLCLNPDKQLYQVDGVNFNQHGLFADLPSVLVEHRRQLKKPGDVEYLDYWLLVSYPLVMK